MKKLNIKDKRIAKHSETIHGLAKGQCDRTITQCGALMGVIVCDSGVMGRLV